jgi:pimeloyl-ACP methyl ester carboxylesterase
MGWSGGGPFALATAAAAPERVSAVGVISGAGPFQEIPALLDDLEGDDRAGAALSTSDREAAATAFAASFADVAAVTNEAERLAAFEPALSARDQRVLASPPFTAAFLLDVQEAFRQGSLGGGWDNVSWVGPWDFPLTSVSCPVLLWYGDEDLMALARGRDLARRAPAQRPPHDAAGLRPLGRAGAPPRDAGPADHG